METLRKSANRHLALADGEHDVVNDRVQRVEETLSEIDERMAQVNHRLDRVLECIDALVQTVAATQHSTQANVEASNQFQEAAAVAELRAHIEAMGRVQELVQQTAAAVADIQQQPTDTPGQTNKLSRPREQDTEMEAPAERKLRRMETKPPVFEGDIDGVKPDSFIFQFEAYFTFTGDLAEDDVVVARELGQCVNRDCSLRRSLLYQRSVHRAHIS
ncbi:hypothetical protein PPTG_07582 [Phytophthora nicotianae INRA-310]|uniref:Uncharacterized protein n=1 Tax=Phytophthora nicotianae (strain INRA-310) TaxID=761204 RepID=W2QMY4_PHYN3|nr:hypothetical protein PPTG_07582 [Phytophthora nicotianae INRA-310]ETN14562.1 hypothetical protein PPTG_07582 [Phytophthora nicotianae INRA-310]